jgi:hemerythrin-like metal-binding protein
MDAEHLQIHRAVADLQAALAAGAESGELESSLRRLAQEVAGHFRHEERLMRLAQYPAYEWHKRQHATARRKLQELAAELFAGGPASTSRALDSLGGWFRDHIGVTDSMASSYLRNHERQRGKSR